MNTSSEDAFRKLQLENDLLRKALTEAHKSYEEEHAKAEWLYGEYNNLHDRRLVRFGYKLSGLSDKLKPRSVARKLYRPVKWGYDHLPLKGSTKERLKAKVYTRFGGAFESTEGYQTWLLLNGRKTDDLFRDGYTALHLPEDLPLTTILIPVYNHLDMTRECLRSIYASDCRSPFEILLADDCSGEDYSPLQAEFPEIRILRNEKNLGFLLSVNHAAREANGDFIVLLNNDTLVNPGWLDELTWALSQHPEAGMIGSALVHISSGKLQESGNAICANGEIVPWGRGADPNDHRYTYFRPVDFCSAASIIMRKSVFLDEMKGFDEYFVPAYFDDTDLGLRLKKAGYTNYVCPLSRVYHHESVSYGNTLSTSGEENRRRFLERWGQYLKEHAAYASKEDVLSGRSDRQRLLYLDAQVPKADRGSGDMDAIFFLQYLKKRGLDVVFHGEYTPGFDPKYSSILLRMGVECICEPYRHIWDYLAEQGGSFRYLFVSRIYQLRGFDTLLHLYCQNAAFIFDTVDLHFVREQLEADLKKDKALQENAAKTKTYELTAIDRADATIVISSDEKKLLEQEYGKERIWHIPQAREVFGLNRSYKRTGAAFIGSAHPPNLDGLQYFHDSVLPLLPEDFHLTIIGEALRSDIAASKTYRALLDCPQYEFVGFVEDLRDVLDHVVMTVAPLRYGAGTKGKVASSMACGVPCVSSEFGTEGTGMIHGENILIARTPEEFAENIKRLDQDQALWETISAGGIRFLEENYSTASVEEKMDALFAAVDARLDAGESCWQDTEPLPKVE